MARPSGTVTFLFTDIEGSTRLWEEQPEAMRRALERHDAILSASISRHDGVVFSTGGDGFGAAFQRADAAIAAAVESQILLQQETWPDGADIRVRMGLHTGEAAERDGDYFGPAVNTGARLMAAGHGGQVLCSAVVSSIALDHLPAAVALRDVGEHRLRDLAEPQRLFQLEHPGIPASFPPLRSLDTYPGNLPVQTTGFVGREKELGEVRRALRESRIVTLCGVGGVGKTRLALQTAAEALPDNPGGAWLVELAAVGDPDGIDGALASVLRVQASPGTTVRNALLAFLRDKHLLLVIDNCEHLVLAVAGFVEAALREAASLRVLATSREGLAVAGERVLTVPPLQMPVPEASWDEASTCDAVRLFLDRARESSSTFSVDADQASAVAELCRRLDGIPLAIELAAARSASMSPGEITRRLSQRFKLLTRGRRTAATRQQTLRNTLDWSFQLLDEDERRVFSRLGVFASDFGIEAAEAVAADGDVERVDVLDLVGRLVEKSLVVAESSSHSTRYRLLETMRDYAWERLDDQHEVDATAERHAAFFLAFAEEAGTALEGPEETEWARRVNQELPNLRASLRWFIESEDTDRALAEVYALSNVYALEVVPFGVLARDAAEMPGANTHPLQVVALASTAMMLAQQGDGVGSMEYVRAAESAIAAMGGNAETAKVRCRVGGCLTTPLAYGDPESLADLARRELRDAQLIGDRYEEMRALILLGSMLGDNDLDAAIEAGEEGLKLAKELRVPSYLAWAPMMLATRIAKRDPARAEALLEAARAVAVETENRWATLTMGGALATVTAIQGRVDDAADIQLSTAELAHELGDTGAMLGALALLARALATLGDDEAALVVGGFVSSHGVDPGAAVPNLPAFTVLGSAYRELTARHEGVAMETLRRRGHDMERAQILEYARSRLSD